MIGYRDGEMHVICSTCASPISSPIHEDDHSDEDLREMATSETLCGRCMHRSGTPATPDVVDQR